MFNKHRHAWHPIAVTFQPPRRSGQVERVNDSTIQMLMLGASTITQRCLDCGWIETVTAPGEAIIPRLGATS